MEGYIEKEVVVDGIRVNAFISKVEYDFKIKYSKCSDDFHKANRKLCRILKTNRPLNESELDDMELLNNYINIKYVHCCSKCDIITICMGRSDGY